MMCGMESQTTDSWAQKQFDAKVFPTELMEIYRRRTLLNIPTEAMAEVEGAVALQKQAEEARPAISGAISRLYQKVSRGFRSATPQGSRAPVESEQTHTKSADDLEKELAAYIESHRITPSTRFGVAGLAISGGGIRSATFAMGVLQGLANHDLLKSIDWISTVSGGGYIGSCLSSVLNDSNHSPTREEFPLKAQPGDEPPSVQHIRQNAKYLDDGKAINIGVMPALVLRGILLNLIVVAPVIIACAILTTLVRYHQGLFVFSTLLDALVRAWTPYWLTLRAVAVFVGWCLLYPFVFRTYRRLKPSQKDRERYEQTFLYGLLLVAGIFLVESLPRLIGFYHAYVLAKGKQWLAILSTAGGMLSTISAILSMGRVLKYLSGWAVKVLILIVGVCGPTVILISYFELSDHLIYDHEINPSLLIYSAILMLALYLFSRWIDVNSTSLHSFYRDRLSGTFLFCLDKGYVVSNDALKLSELNKGTAPYHLINVTLNLPASRSVSLHGRGSDFFVLSKHFCGSPSTGYIETAKLEDRDPHLDLGTAFAVSAAAAAPNMGKITIKPLVLLMTILNIRLGYWLPNPAVLRAGSILQRTLSGAGPTYLLREMFGKIDEDLAFVNLSDGGHLENLGVYELLRRRCKYLIVVDGEADPEMTFPGLAAVMRYARIDKGIDIQIDLSDLRKDAAGCSASHCALGTIDYGKGEFGYLLYIKSSFSGDENEYVRQYKATHPSFPHQSTADQFFDEAQFEAYRSLGHHAFESLFATGETKEKAFINDWFEDLTRTCRPRFSRAASFTSLQSDLVAIGERFTDPAVASYTYEIFPELVPQGPGSEQRIAEIRNSSDHRNIFHLCDAQIQLMENVYIALQLDNHVNRDDYMNRGWMNLFNRWATAPSFRKAWAVTISTYSDGFQRFCEEVLDLKYEIQWRQGSTEDVKSEKLASEFFNNGDQVWVPEIRIRIDLAAISDAFPVGLVIMRLEHNRPVLIFYSIRQQFRKMRLLECTMTLLPQRFAPQKIEVRLAQQDTRFHEFFRRKGFKVTTIKEAPNPLKDRKAAAVLNE
jgi:hypothetical protein